MNGFLRGLTEESFGALQPHLSPVDLVHAHRLYGPGDRVQWVHFAETALISLLAVNSDGQMIETSMGGCEGAVGLVEACGSGEAALDASVQVDGHAWRAPARVVRNLVASDPSFSASAWKLLEFQLAESRQAAVCNAMHMVESRFARWMLESFDRSMGRNPLPMTQEFMAAMLGVQRTTVTAFAKQLQRMGLIDYGRGRVELIDLAGLEARACDCRQFTRAQRERLGLSLPALSTS